MKKMEKKGAVHNIGIPHGDGAVIQLHDGSHIHINPHEDNSWLVTVTPAQGRAIRFPGERILRALISFGIVSQNPVRPKKRGNGHA